MQVGVIRSERAAGAGAKQFGEGAAWCAAYLATLRGHADKRPWHVTGRNAPDVHGDELGDEHRGHRTAG